MESPNRWVTLLLWYFLVDIVWWLSLESYYSGTRISTWIRMNATVTRVKKNLVRFNSFEKGFFDLMALLKHFMFNMHLPGSKIEKRLDRRFENYATELNKIDSAACMNGIQSMLWILAAYLKPVHTISTSRTFESSNRQILVSPHVVQSLLNQLTEI